METLNENVQHKRAWSLQGKAGIILLDIEILQYLKKRPCPTVCWKVLQCLEGMHVKYDTELIAQEGINL